MHNSQTKVKHLNILSFFNFYDNDIPRTTILLGQKFWLAGIFSETIFAISALNAQSNSVQIIEIGSIPKINPTKCNLFLQTLLSVPVEQLYNKN